MNKRSAAARWRRMWSATGWKWKQRGLTNCPRHSDGARVAPDHDPGGLAMTIGKSFSLRHVRGLEK
ncbi:hypothetical protein [Bradyrhizobium sp. CCBAU 51627]|uniref:hypothetical protein n=1 Tax=Bradyrhizobium sp. CCBAU 51627 TaxID=1325088 RepID=UPI002305F463|nr:hypothetical protein [Bradyrhizobium sp. CCBAU 51627]MDA9433437.1 hypothetical protein [Bradyrhizobium sp. CCBAU 51627]